RHTRFSRDWSSDVCSSDLGVPARRRLPLFSFCTVRITSLQAQRYSCKQLKRLYVPFLFLLSRAGWRKKRRTAHPSKNLLQKDIKIGRASCRKECRERCRHE